MIRELAHRRRPVCGDWGSGLELKRALLGDQSQLELHHIFPKALLRDAGYSQPEINAVANFTFLTMETNREISDKRPEVYIPAHRERHPGSVKSHWVPDDQTLLAIDRYLDFLAERRELLAEAANTFLDELLQGILVVAVDGVDVLEHDPVVIIDEEDDELPLLNAINDWVLEHGLTRGTTNLEILDPDSGETVAVLDLAWPTGVQDELSEPVALMLNEEASAINASIRFGYRPFEDPEELKEWVRRTVLERIPRSS